MLPKTTCLFCAAVFFMVCGLMLTFIWPVILKVILRNKLVLTPESEAYDPWMKTPFVLPLDIYLFNWTNPGDIYDSSVKPKLQQVGPYRYLENSEKANVRFNDNGTVTFQRLKFWQYDNSEGNGDLQGRINMINLVLVAAAHAVRSSNYLIRKGLAMTLYATASNISMTHTIDELLFKGSENPLVKMSLFSDTAPSVDRFGFFYKRNGSVNNEGTFNMGTGVNSEFGKLYSWNYMTQTSFYSGSCNKIGGSPGDFFPLTSDKSSISLLLPNLCRNVVLRKVGETEVESILGYKYAIEGYALDNGTLYPENKCHCNGECIPSGVWNVSSCSYDAPLFVSLPHFYNADPYYTNLVEGLNPQKSEHEFYIVLEPTTNIVLEVDARIQVNLWLQPVEDISVLTGVPRVFFPLMWTRQHVKIPSEDASKLRLLLMVPSVFCAVGVSVTILGTFLLACVIYKHCVVKKEDSYLYEEQTIPFKSDCDRGVIDQSTQKAVQFK